MPLVDWTNMCPTQECVVGVRVSKKESDRVKMVKCSCCEKVKEEFRKQEQEEHIILEIIT